MTQPDTLQSVIGNSILAALPSDLERQAIQQILNENASLKLKVHTLETDKALVEKRYAEQVERAGHFEKLCQELQAELAPLKAQQLAFAQRDRVELARDAELKAAGEKVVLLQDMMTTVFRNTQIRENILRAESFPETQHYSGGGGHTTYRTVEHKDSVTKTSE